MRLAPTFIALLALLLSTAGNAVAAAHWKPRMGHVVASCSWDRPGHDPFTGDVVAAIDRYIDIPTPVRMRLKQRMQERRYDELVDIRRDSISGRERYDAVIRDMHFGLDRVCREVTRARWTAQMHERGLVYCEQGHCILVPTVCRNVSRIKRLPTAVAATRYDATPDETSSTAIAVAPATLTDPGTPHSLSFAEVVAGGGLPLLPPTGAGNYTPTSPGPALSPGGGQDTLGPAAPVAFWPVAPGSGSSTPIYWSPVGGGGAGTPGGSTSGSGPTGGYAPGGGSTGTGAPGGSTPGGGTPGASTPGSTTPGGTTPGGTAPGGSTPGGSTPGGSTPGGSTPGGTTPGGSTPGSTTPGDTTPGGGTPGSSTPGGSTPGGSTPGGTTPGGGTPGGSTPGGSTPGGSTPGGSTPGGSTPGGSTPGGGDGGGWGPILGDPGGNPGGGDPILGDPGGNPGGGNGDPVYSDPGGSGGGSDPIYVDPVDIGNGGGGLGTVPTAPIPEPSTWLSLLLGLFALSGAVARRKRSAARA